MAYQIRQKFLQNKAAVGRANTRTSTDRLKEQMRLLAADFPNFYLEPIERPGAVKQPPNSYKFGQHFFKTSETVSTVIYPMNWLLNFKSKHIMFFMQLESRKKWIGGALLILFIAVLHYSCNKSDHQDAIAAPIISFKQKVISIAEDAPMIPVRPDSTGGPIAEYSVYPGLPKGIMLDKANGVISGQPSDTLSATKYVVTATGPGGRSTDTLTMLIGTVGFSYGNSSSFVFERGSTELAATPITPVILAGNFSQFFITPSQDSLKLKTGLIFDTRNGQISGTPTVITSTTEVSQTLSFTITGITTSNKAASSTVSFTINDKKPVFNYTFTGSFTVGTSVGNTLSPVKPNTSGNIVKYRIAPESPALPEGLTLDSLTGAIKGVPAVAADVTITVRGLNSGGHHDTRVPLLINATAVAPQVKYMMSLFSGNVTDTLAAAIGTGNTVYVTKSPDAFGGVNIFLNPVLTAGQANTVTNTFVATPAFTSGTTNENISINSTTGIISGTPGQFNANSSPAHAISIGNAVTGGQAGSFNMNIVANSAFFTYNADGGKGSFNQNIYGLVQGQPVDVANGNFPGYTVAGLKPVGGTGVVSYSIFPSTGAAPAFSSTGLTLDAATGAISGTPSVNTFGLNTYTFWDYVVMGKKEDGSFTLYKIRFKIYKTAADWGSL